MSEIGVQVSSSIDSLTEEFNIITHNLANVSTVGYKRRCTAFSKALETAQSQAGGAEQMSLDTTFDFSQGGMMETARPLDFALSGKGFFVLETTEGPLYTRNGIFLTNQNGQIVDTAGRTVAGQAGPISIPANVGLSELSVSDDGTISAGGVTIGRFRVVDFGENENELISVGDGCFRMPDEGISPVPAEGVIVKQGYQESSNVKMVEELVNMIMVSRLYEANVKLISAQREASDSLMSVATG